MRISNIGLRMAAMAAAAFIPAGAMPALDELKVAEQQEAARRPRRRQTVAEYIGSPKIRMNRSRRWRDEPDMITTLSMAQRYRWARQEVIATLHTVQNLTVR